MNAKTNEKEDNYKTTNLYLMKVLIAANWKSFSQISAKLAANGTSER